MNLEKARKEAVMKLEKARRRAYLAAYLCMGIGVVSATVGFLLLLASAWVELISPSKYLAIGQTLTITSTALLFKGLLMSVVAIILIPYLDQRHDASPRKSPIRSGHQKVSPGS